MTRNGISLATLPADQPVRVHTRIAAAMVVPAIIAGAGETATRRFPEVFAATIRSKKTCMAYYCAICQFLAWCDRNRIGEIGDVEPLHVSAYIEAMPADSENSSVKQLLAAIRMLFDWLVIGQVIAVNPAISVRGPKHVINRGETSILTGEQARELLNSIDNSRVAGLRDRTLISVMTFAFARVSAVVAMRVQDYYPQGKHWWVRLHEKGGKRHEMPAHHNLEAYLDSYIEAAGLEEAARSPSSDRPRAGPAS